MPVPPQPFKVKCPKCEYSKVVHPKSDVIDPKDYLNVCPKCNVPMEKVVPLFKSFKTIFYFKFFLVERVLLRAVKICKNLNMIRICLKFDFEGNFHRRLAL